jgi:hypothetical protein
MPVTLNANSSTGFIATSDTSTILQLQTGGTTAVTVDASQNVGIGVSSPESGFKLHVSGNAFVQNIAGQTVGKVVVDNADNRLVLGSYFEAGVGQYSFISSTDNAETGNISLLFRTGSTERMRILSTGNILSLSGGSTTATGTGIAFPATQSASTDVNTLDDYEEGTWTPGISFGGASVGVTYSQQVGRYVKVGKQVTVNGYLYLSSKGSSTGAAKITGLPFPMANIASFFPGSCLRANTVATTFSGAIQFYLTPNDATVSLEYLASGTATPVQNTGINNTTDTCFSITYITEN